MNTTRALRTEDDGNVPTPAGSDAPDFDDFFRQEYVRVARMLVLLTGSKPDAEDIAQEAFARVLARWERVSMMESPAGYVRTVAVNLYRRRGAAARREVPLAAAEGCEPASADRHPQVEARADLRRLLQLLPQNQRDALVLVEWVGLDAATAGAHLGISAVSVRSRILRARRALARNIQQLTSEGDSERDA